MKVRCNRHPEHHSAAGQIERKRRLTKTLLLVTIGLLFTWLPVIIYQGLINFHFHFLLTEWVFHADITMRVIYFANSLINPIIYALWMPKLRAGVSQLFRLNRNRLLTVDLPLRNLHHGVKLEAKETAL